MSMNEDKLQRILDSSSEGSVKRPIEASATVHVLTVLTLCCSLHITQVACTVVLAFGAVEGTETHHLHQHLILGHISAEEEFLHLLFIVRRFRLGFFPAAAAPRLRLRFSLRAAGFSSRRFPLRLSSSESEDESRLAVFLPIANVGNENDILV